MKEAFERLDRREPGQQLFLSLGRKGTAMLARLDHLAQPQALLMAADVLDFIRDRAAVRRAQRRQGVGQRLWGAGAIDAQHLGGNPRHDLGREAKPADIERRIARRLRAQRVEVGGEMAEIPVGSN